MDKATQKIYDAFRKGTAQLDGIPEDRQDDHLINVRTTDLVAILDALDAALANAKPLPAAPASPKSGS